MATARSPFYIVQGFLSPKYCEQIVDSLGFYTPDETPDGKPQKMVRHHEKSEDIIFNGLQVLIPSLMAYYDVEYRGTEHMLFEFYAQETLSEPLCENSNYLRSKWVRTKERDLSGVLFLSDFNDNVPFDSEYEVYGGKLEFPQHKFGFNPQRGTLIIYPSDPHFINATSPILFGDLYQVRLHIATKKPYLYDPTKFPGDYRTWFKGL